MVLIGAVLGLLVDLRSDKPSVVAVVLGSLVATVLWRRWSWSTEVSAEGLLVRRFRHVRRRPARLGAARVVGRASQLRLQVCVDDDWRTLPAPRCLTLAGDDAFRCELERFGLAWEALGKPVERVALGAPLLVLRRRLVQAWPWLLLCAASLVWQVLEPTMGGDLTAVAAVLIVLLQVRQPRPVLSEGIWVGDGDRFVPWQDVSSISVVSRRGVRRVVLVGKGLRERLASPVDAWWAPDHGFVRTYEQLCAAWERANAPLRIDLGDGDVFSRQRSSYPGS